MCESRVIIPCGFTNYEYNTNEEVSALPLLDNDYGIIFHHLHKFENECRARSDQGDYWWELRPCDYLDLFFRPKIAWPDIAKSNRFAMDHTNSIIGNTGYIIPNEDYYLLGILNSLVTWFAITGISISFGERSGLFRYRLIRQYMEKLPIPCPDKTVRESIAALSKACSEIANTRHTYCERFRYRIQQTFGNGVDAKQTERLQDWPSLTFNEIGLEVKKSYKLRVNPWSNPSVADDWESYWRVINSKVLESSNKLLDIQSEIDDWVFRLFDLNNNEVKTLKTHINSDLLERE